MLKEPLKNNQEKIKTLLIDKIIKDNKKLNNYIICSEVPFLSGKRWADLIIIKKNNIIAYEIKSDLDSLKRLPEQMKDYSNTFDKVYLVLSKKFKKIPSISQNIGLLRFENEKLFKERVAQTQKKLKKENLSYFLWKQDLQKYIINKDEGEINKLRNIFINKYKTEQIKKIAISCLRERYERRFELFLYDRNEKTHLEDLYLLSNKHLEIY